MNVDDFVHELEVEAEVLRAVSHLAPDKAILFLVEIATKMSTRLGLEAHKKIAGKKIASRPSDPVLTAVKDAEEEEAEPASPLAGAAGQLAAAGGEERQVEQVGHDAGDHPEKRTNKTRGSVQKDDFADGGNGAKNEAVVHSSPLADDAPKNGSCDIDGERTSDDVIVTERYTATSSDGYAWTVTETARGVSYETRGLRSIVEAKLKKQTEMLKEKKKAAVFR
jgi:hypothetical protein